MNNILLPLRNFEAAHVVETSTTEGMDPQIHRSKYHAADNFVTQGAKEIVTTLLAWSSANILVSPTQWLRNICFAPTRVQHIIC